MRHGKSHVQVERGCTAGLLKNKNGMGWAGGSKAPAQALHAALDNVPPQGSCV